MKEKPSSLLGRGVLGCLEPWMKIMDKNEWKIRVQEILTVCHEEFRKTTTIGKKMLSASRTTTNLHEAYEELGRLLYEAMTQAENGLKTDSFQGDGMSIEEAAAQREVVINQVKDLLRTPRVMELFKEVKACHEDLEMIEREVQKIKFAAGPEVAGTKKAPGNSNTNRE